MLLRLASSFLLLTVVVWGEEGRILRLRPPFSGLYQNINQADLPDNAFFILSNAALSSSGEIYKRGAFETVHSITGATENALKIDSNSNNPGVDILYRYYRSNGLRRLLAASIGPQSQ